ncbi:MAG: sugar phosphate isomerase/epimerase family protein [Faecousia sp.]
MKLGMPLLYEYGSIAENLRLARELALDFVELNLNFGYCRREMEAGTVQPLLERYGIRATLHFYDEADLGSYPEVVDAYMTLLERYCRAGRGYVESVNLHLCPGPVVTIAGEKHYIYDKEYDDYIVRLLENLHRAERICRDNGMDMVVENTDYLPPFTRGAYRAMCAEGFRFCYDIGHDHTGGDVLDEIRREVPLQFREFHFHDGKDGKKCHLALGEGEIDLKKFKALAASSDAWVNLEVKQSADLRSSVPYFRAL